MSSTAKEPIKQTKNNSIFYILLGSCQGVDDLVQEFIKHSINKYGLAKVETWYFGVWDESDSEDTMRF